ncbi:MAG: hypothetical protein ABFD10_17825, partial [Prolixibacteraceae bacterium]
MNKNQMLKGLTRRDALKLGAGAVVGVAAFGRVSALASETIPSMNQNQNIQNFGFLPERGELKVDFSYAFSTPHRITIGRPDASDRTLMDLEPDGLKMSWTYDNLTMANYPPLAFRTPKTLWDIRIKPEIDGKPLAKSRWNRFDAVLPGLENTYEDTSGSVRLKALSGMTAALVRIEIANTDINSHQYVIRCDCNWGMNPAWVDPIWNLGDNLQAGWNDRADRVLVLGLGADAYSLRDDHIPPGAQNMILVWNLKPGEKSQGWIVRPYSGYEADLAILRKNDWALEMEQGKKEWNNLLKRASKPIIPDEGITNAYQACLADLFIMREPLGEGRIVGVPGTEGYRAGNSGEPLIVAVALDQNGLHDESLAESSTSVNVQEPDGCWADKGGWCHLFWAASGFKSRAIMEHYRITGDKKYLAKVYPRMIASSRWQERQRARMRIGNNNHSLTYGLMPRGFGDCGLKNDEDNYGVFFPHNIWSVYADRCSLEAAEILGKTRDIAELKKIYETAYNDLLIALDRGAIKEKDYRWIPGVPGKTSGSCWGTLNILSPCELLSPDHELVTGTLRKIESNMSKGGQPIHTGWMADGAWVAITLDNIAEAHLSRGNGDTAVRYLYSTLNHGTPFYTWCEERGQEPGTTKTSGDLQHLWTPVAVVRFIRDMMVMENGDGLNLALGTAREWLASGEKIGISGACTHFGKVSYHMQYDSTKSKVTGEICFDEHTSAAWANLYIRLPEGLNVKSVDPGSKAVILPDG